MRITTNNQWGLLGNTLVFVPTNPQLIRHHKSNTQTTHRYTLYYQRLTQIMHLKQPLTTTLIATFAHFHTPNNKE